MFLINRLKLIQLLKSELHSAREATIKFRKKFASTLALVLSLQFAVSPASAYDGNELLKGLKAGDGSFGEGFAWGNVLGIYEVLIKSGLAGQCIVVPRGTKNSQILDIVRLFLEANPSRRQQPSLVLVFVALSQTYPISDVDENGLCPHGF